jgi:Xaa-Pro aminopeptidase
LNGFRRETEGFHSLSFDPISAAGLHGSMPHYWPSEASNIPIERNSLYLIDSGGQYPDGTTDVTRTVAVGTPTAEMKDRFTRVLKGHIALDRAVFPAGTLGFHLDGFARRALWDAGWTMATAPVTASAPSCVCTKDRSCWPVSLVQTSR